MPSPGYNNPMPKSPKIALVTGGAGALGAGVVQVLREAGIDVVVADRQPPRDGDIRYRATNLLDEESVRGLVSELAAAGGFDILVNLVGGFTLGSVAESSSAALDEMYALNLKPVFTVCRFAVPVLAARGGGKIVNVAARPAVVPVAGMAAYAVTKAAVARLTEVLALETLAQNIQVNAVLPSVIDTPANRSAMPQADPSRWVTPQSIGKVIRFLSSDDANDVSGALLPVYGRS